MTPELYSNAQVNALKTNKYISQSFVRQCSVFYIYTYKTEHVSHCAAITAIP